VGAGSNWSVEMLRKLVSRRGKLSTVIFADMPFVRASLNERV
jgi:hypothetical protein